jgi:3-oxoacyl-[acyl-carrier protein] reductase
MKRTALITGASRGIGAAIAEAFKADGIKVIAPSHKEMDLSSNASVDAFMSTQKENIDILVNDAGINPIAEIAKLQDKNIEETIRINLVSPIRLIRAVSPLMIRNGYGRILNISSIWSAVSMSGRAVYAASKSGLDSVTRTAAIELAKHGILVNSIAPGFVNTELTKQNNTKQQLEQIKKLIPLGRLAETKEVAQLALFLCSEKNTYLTGQTLFVDGGYTCL